MSGRHGRIEMHYSEIEKTSLVNFAYVLLKTGTTWLDLPCRTNLVKDVYLNETNLNEYLPQERKCSDGTSYTRQPIAPGNLLSLLRKSEGSVVTIFTHNGEAHYFAIDGDNVVSKGYDNNCWWGLF